jgi:hypothetical protein
MALPARPGLGASPGQEAVCAGAVDRTVGGCRRALAFLEPNKNSERLRSCLQTQSETVLFSESGTERLHSLIFLNQTPGPRIHFFWDMQTARGVQWFKTSGESSASSD